MSWDNVTSIEKISFYAGSSSDTATLFLNGNHQVPLTVTITFNLSGTAPTDDEVSKAITLINDINGAPLSTTADSDPVTPLISSTQQGNFANYYDPNVEKPAVLNDTSSPQTVSFYVSGSSSAAPTDSQAVALEIKYSKSSSSEPVIYNTSANGNASIKAKVTINFIARKMYGKSGNTDGYTTVTFIKDDITSKCSYTNLTSGAKYGFGYLCKYTMAIEDGPFKLHQVEYDTKHYTPSENDDTDSGKSYIYPIFIQGLEDNNHYSLYYDTYVASYFSATADDYIYYDFCHNHTSNGFNVLGTIKVPFTKKDTEYIWHHAQLNYELTGNRTMPLNQQSNLVCYDQYGNTFYAVVKFFSGGPVLDSVTTTRVAATAAI